MSSSEPGLFEWSGDALQAIDYCDPAEVEIRAADSWLVTAGTALALDLHHARFASAVEQQVGPSGRLDLDTFWDAVIDAIPRDGDRFPRVELQRYRGRHRLIARQRLAPPLTESVTLATHAGQDPRTRPLIKGPDTASLLRARSAAQQRGADEAVLLSPDGFIAEGAYSAIVWWRGEVLCLPSPEIERVDSITAKSLVALATALGVEIHYESAVPAELDLLEVWALSALHGPRIVTAWVDGPSTAAEPGRLHLWRARLHRLRKPLPVPRTR